MTEVPHSEVRRWVKGSEPWQLQMFRRTLKKQQKLLLLQELLGDLEGHRCLLVTCGDNNGAMNWHLREGGGNWSWVDAEAESARQIHTLTGDETFLLDKQRPALPFADGVFDDVVAVDIHEHSDHPERLNRELSRVAALGCRVIVTTPNGDVRKPMVRLKRALGMTPEVYGHVVVGYEIPDLERQLEQVGLQPFAARSYAYFFTELLELAINFLYVKVLARRSPSGPRQGQIVPQSREQLREVGKAYRAYSIAFPIVQLMAKLDFLDPSEVGYAVVVAARKSG